jgi:hypothetical protein
MMEHREDARSEPRRAAQPIRTVWDAEAGREWRVWATDCRGVPGARSALCLIFDCGTTVRRVWAPPDDWRALPDDALLALVESRRDR